MAPSKPIARNGAADTHIQAVISFATKLLGILSDPSTFPSALRRELETHIRQIPTLNNAAVAAHARTFDARGTDLWNAAAPLLGNQLPPSDVRIKSSHIVCLGLHVRVFALILLNAAHATLSRRAKDQNQHIRILKIALRAVKSCLDRNDLDSAHMALEICSQYARDDSSESLIQLSSDPHENGNSSVVILRMLTAEYYLLRLLHAWKSGRMDLAEHFYHKIGISGKVPDVDLATKAADMLFELAKSLAKEQDPELAVKWYDRAFKFLDGCEVESLSQDAIELLLCIGIALADRLIATDLPTGRQRAWDVVEQLEKSHGICNRIAIPLIKFRILASERQPDAKQISQPLFRLTKLIVLTDDSFKLVMQTIKKAVNVSVDCALTVLKSFICVRIVPETRSSNSPDSKIQTWLEKATISYILYATTPRNLPGEAPLRELNELLDTIHNGSGVKFTTKATHASQTLLWKASDTTDLETAYAWIQLLRHALFEQAGPLNKTRICRKLMRTAFEEGNVVVAREAFMELPAVSQNEPLTRYLAFKLALRTHDESLAMKSLKTVMKAANKDPNCLYACVLEAQQSESRRMAVAALQAILDERPDGTHLPSLLRCTARLLIAEFDVQGRNCDDVLLELLQVFETAAKCMDEISLASGDQWRSEALWWSKNTYNLAIRLTATVRPESLVRLLDVCNIFLGRFPNDIELKQQERVEHRKLLCTFLATTALIVLGRSGGAGEDEYTIQCFVHAQQRIDTFKKIWENLKYQSTDGQDNARAFAILKFELECILRLEKWECLGGALQACLDAPSICRWDTLADLLIIVHEQLDEATKRSHTEMMTQLLQRIINDTWKKDKNIAKVARWLRFTFMLCLGHSQGNFSFKLLEQAANMAENGERGKHDRYPESELQWLATTSFNHAIDLLIDEEEDAALLWIDGALALARWSNDNGSLHASFTGKKEIAMKRAQRQ